MLPRRATGDFRDVFSKGFQFDSITGSMAIERGVLASKDFHMNGPAADVAMNGQVDLAPGNPEPQRESDPAARRLGFHGGWVC